MPPDPPPEPGTLEQSRERRRGVQQACVDLEQALARPASPDAVAWSTGVGGALDELSQAFNRHVEHSEGPDGLLGDITTAAPRLAHAVDQIRGEHVGILAEIDQVRTQASVDRDAPDAHHVRTLSLSLLQSVAAHRYRGADLVYDAYMVDIEAAD